MLTQSFFNKFFRFINLYQNAKNLDISSYCFGQKKILTKFFKKFKNIFGSFPLVLGNFFFFKKFGPVTQDFIWVSNTILKFRKNIQFQEHVQIEGWKDVQILFYRILQATAGVEIWMVLSKKLFSSLSVINNTKCFFIQNLRTFTESSVLPLSSSEMFCFRMILQKYLARNHSVFKVFLSIETFRKNYSW